MHENISTYATPRPALTATLYFRYLMHLYHSNYILFHTMKASDDGKTTLIQKGHYHLRFNPPQKNPYTETLDLICTFKTRKMRRPLPLIQLKVRIYNDAGQIEVLRPWPVSILGGRCKLAARFLSPPPRRGSALMEKWSANSALARVLRYFG